MSEHYEFIRAIVTDGALRWEYRLKGNPVTGRASHDEDVSDWTDQSIKELTRQALNVEPDDPVEIEVQHN